MEKKAKTFILTECYYCKVVKTLKCKLIYRVLGKQKFLNESIFYKENTPTLNQNFQIFIRMEKLIKRVFIAFKKTGMSFISVKKGLFYIVLIDDEIVKQKKSMTTDQRL